MEEFIVGLRLNNRFNSLVAFNFTLEGTGAAVILGAFYFDCIPCMIAGLILVGLGALALFIDLGTPANSWRSIFNPWESWISRGAIFLVGLLLFSLPYAGLAGLRGSDAAIIFKVGGTVSAVLIMSYTGFLLGTMKAIPFWNSRMLPPIFFTQSLVSGVFILHLTLLIIRPELAASDNFQLAEILLLLTGAAAAGVHLLGLPSKSPAARESVRRLFTGKLRFLFWGGGIGLGIVLPLMFAVIGYRGEVLKSGLSIWLLIATAGRLVGDFLFRKVYLKSGFYESILE
jgi:formate-dependent nitrite reductase membrane component NrfD